MITALFAAVGGAKLLAIVGAIIAAVLSLFGIYKAGHSVGTAQANAQNATDQATVAVAEAEKSAAVRTETVKETSDVQAQTSTMDANAVADSLREFQRDASPVESGNANSALSGQNPNG